MAEDIKIELSDIDLSDLDVEIPKIDIDLDVEVPKIDTDKKIDLKFLQDNIKTNLTKNNKIDTNKQEDYKKSVYNPLSFIRFFPELYPIAQAMDAKDAELINQGKKAKFFPREKNQTDLALDIQKGIITGPILALKSLAELATSGIDWASGELPFIKDTNFTKELDVSTRAYLEEHGNPETWQGDVTRLVTQYGFPGTIAFKIVGNIGKINSVGKTYKKLRSYLSAIENKYIRKGAKFITSVAKRSGQAGLALGITDATIKSSEEDTFKIKKVSEEGKSGKDLAVARLLNKIKFGQEGTVIGAGFGLASKALPIAAKYGIYKPGTIILGTGLKALNTAIVNPATNILAGSTKTAIDSILTKIVNKKGIYSKFLQTTLPVIKPVAGVIDLPGKYVIKPSFKKTVEGLDFLTREIGGRVVLPFVSRNAFVKSFKAKLPPFKDWNTFSVTNSDPLKSALKKVDDKLQYLRSAAKMTGEQQQITTAARNFINMNARRTEKLLESIEKRAYNLAKSFETQYNTAKTSPASQEKYLNDVLEYIQGEKLLYALPKELQVTAKALNDTFIETKKIYGKFLPEGDLKNLILKNIDSYVRRSFSIFTNPAYSVPENSKLFTDAVKFARGVVERSPNLIEEATKIFGADDIKLNQIKDSAAKDMVKKILRLGKQDSADPIVNLQNVSKFLNLKRFIGTGDELPTVIKNLLGQEKSLRGSVLATNADMTTQVSNKLMFDQLGPILQKAGMLFKSEIDAKKAGILDPFKLQKADGLGLLKSKLIDPKNPYYGGRDIIEALETSKGFLDNAIQSGWYRNVLQLKTGVQYGKTVLSPETQVRNFFSAGMFPLARGLIGGRASVTDSIKMVVDDIWNAGKGDPQAELRLLDSIDEGIKYGVLDESIVASELQAVLKEVRNGTVSTINDLASFLAKNPFTEKAARVYAGSDNVWKWYTYNWYKSFTKDLFKGNTEIAKKWFKDIANLDAPPGDIDELIKQASAWYTTNTVPTYSKVSPFIQNLRRTPFGNFVSFPAEMLRTSFNNLNISMREAASDNPTLRAMGIRGLIGMYTVMGGAFYAVKSLYNSMTFFTDDMIETYKRYFAKPYEKNSNMLPITKVKEGKFKVINMSDFIPYAAVTEPIEAFFNTRKNNILAGNDVSNSLLIQMFSPDGPVINFLQSYISPAIGLEPFVDIIIRKGVTKRGTIIYSETDQPKEKFDKMLEYTLRVMEPGVITSGRKFYDAFIKQPSPSGVVRDLGDVAVGAATGIKPFDVNILESLDKDITNFSKIRTDVFKAENFYKFNELYRRGGDVLVEEFIDIQEEAFRLQKQTYDAIQAAKKFDISDTDIKELMKQRSGLSDKAIRLIMSGKFNPVNFSELIFEKKIRTLAKREGEFGIKYDLPNNFLFPKNDLKKVIRELESKDLNKPFYYNQIKNTKDLKSDLPIDIETITQEPQQVSQKIETPPLTDTPMPSESIIQTTQQASGVMNQGLTATENALLSEEEKSIRLRQRGLA